MSNESPPIVRPRRRLPRVPPFYPVPLRATHNAFTPRLQAHFLGFLAETGSVSQACARVGKSRKSAYKLRERAGSESFCAAWDAALGKPYSKVTIDDLDYLAYHGLIRPRFRAGKYIGSVQKPDNSALLKLVRRFDRMCDGIVARGDNPGRIKTHLCDTRGDTRGPEITPSRTGSWGS